MNMFDFAGHTVSVPTSQLCLCGVKADIDNIKVNERGCGPVILYLLTVVSEFQIIFTGHISNSFQSFQSVKTIVGSQAVQKVRLGP